MDWLTTSEGWLSLLMLSSMEVILGIDNIIFIGILAGRLPKDRRESARRLGLMGALVSRLALLFAISWIAKLTTPLFDAFGVAISGRALILICGGLFLLFKATKEIHHKLEDLHEEPTHSRAGASFWSVIAQIMVLDVVFSLDSVITAVGMAQDISIMVIANVLALAVMLAVGGVLNRFIDRHPTIKILALSFLLMIGIALVGEGLGLHVPKGYLYFAMGFSAAVEMINIRMSARAGQPKPLSQPSRLNHK